MADPTPPASLFNTAVQELYTTHVSGTKEAIEKAAQRRTHTIHDMTEYMKRAGLLHALTNDGLLRIIHIAGTKGKGSTVSMCESITRRAYGLTPTLMFTSPHLVDIRERIRVNGEMVSKEVFGETYWRLRRRLDIFEDGEIPALPGYFRMLTLMVFYLTVHYRNELDQPVATLLLEVGMGGRYDATNSYMQLLAPSQHFVVGKGVTLIDYDHVRVLGNTLEEIAWEKGGIYRGPLKHGQSEGVSDETAPHPQRSKAQFQAQLALLNTDEKAEGQESVVFALGTNPESVCNVFRICAKIEGRYSLRLVGRADDADDRFKDITIGLPGEHQRSNAKLAYAVCKSIVSETEQPAWSSIAEALALATWPGRCQSIRWETVPRCTFRIDGAHTPESVKVGLDWYRNAASDPASRRVLVFYCGHERNPVDLFQLLLDAKFDRVLICPPASSRPSGVAYPSTVDLLQDTEFAAVIPVDTKSCALWYETLLEVWSIMANFKGVKADISSAESVRNVLELLAIDFSDSMFPVEIFVTGSLYLAGSFLEELHWTEPDAKGYLTGSADVKSSEEKKSITFKSCFG